MTPSRITLESLVRHAEKFAPQSVYGAECVYETAEQTRLPALELGYLARHLRRIDTHWRLTLGQRDRLILALSDAGVADKEIRDLAKITQPTLRKLRESPRPADPGPLDRINTGLEVKEIDRDKESPVPADLDALERSETLL